MSNKEELQVTSFLAERLSLALGVKFSAESENKQDSDTDTYIVSASGEKTPVQNVTSEGKVSRDMNFNKKFFPSREPFVVGEVSHLEWILNALVGKEEKQYSNAKSLIIALRGSMPTIPASKLRAMFENIISTFAGIYYISVPNSSEDSGYVVALKKYWNTEDIF